MGLFNRKKSKKEEIEYIAVILLKDDEGIGFVCKINPAKQTVDIIDERSFAYSNAWENLVYDVDELLFNIENIHSIEVKKATFFVYSHLIDMQSGELKEAYLNSLKDVISENKLESLGYIELEESLAKSYTLTEQSPLNAVLVEVDKPAVSAFVYRGGQRIFAETVAKTQDLVSDLEAIFNKTEKGTLLPARVIMYDSSRVESESHSILTHSWPENLFVQLPRVDVVKEHELKQAIVQGVKEELFGASVARMPAAGPTAAVAAMSSKEEDLSEATQKEIEDDIVEKPSIEETVDNDDGEDVSSEKQSSAAMGFVVGEDVRETRPQTSGSEQKDTEGFIQDPSKSVRMDTQAEVDVGKGALEDDFVTQPLSEVSESDGKLSKLKDMASGLIARFKLGRGNGPVAPAAQSKKGLYMKIGIGAAGIVLLIAAVFASLYFFHNATLTVLYDSDNITDELTLSEEDIEFTEFSETFTVTASVATTGSQDIGEKAEGPVTLYNADESERTFESGTQLQTDDGLVFVLDETVTIEGATKTITDDGDVLTSTSKLDTTVTAAEIGTSYNIKNNTDMSIDGLSDTTYFAKSTSAFTGGTSETVQTASSDDFDEVDALIDAEISKKSKEKLAEIAEMDNIIEDLTAIERTDETYSAELSEEADSLDAEVTADVTFYSFDDSKIKEMVLSDIKDDIPEGYVVSTKNVTYTIDAAEQDEETGEISIELTAEAQPALKIDEEALIADVRGSSLDAIRSDLEKKYKADGFEAEVTSPLPFLRSRLPWFSQNITVELKPLSK